MKSDNKKNKKTPQKIKKNEPKKDFKEKISNIIDHIKEHRGIYFLFPLIVVAIVLVLVQHQCSVISKLSVELSLSLIIIIFFSLIILIFTFFDNNEIIKYLSLSRKFLYQIIITLLSVVIIGFVVWFGVDAYEAEKNDLSLKDFLSKPFHHPSTCQDFTNKQPISADNNFNCNHPKNTDKDVDLKFKRPKHYFADNYNTSNLLDDTSNILSNTSNLITYITLLFLIISILGGYGIYKYFTEFKKLKDSVEAADRNVLDSALTTISAVPFIEATQITSDEYYRAIDNITKTVIEKRVIVEKESEYAPLLIVEALDNWKNRDYDKTIEILKKAYKLADQSHSKELKKEIAFHLGRAYKQSAYETKKEARKEEYFEKAEYYANNTLPEQKKVIKLSVASIKYSRDKAKIEDIEEKLRNCIGIKNNRKINDSENEILKYTIEHLSFDRLTAFTVIALLGNNIFNENIVKHCAKESLKFLEEEIHSQKGSNIKASWYNTMYQLSKENKEVEDYNSLSKLYQEKAKVENDRFLIFNPVLLIEK